MTRQNTTVQQTPLLRNSTNYQAFVQTGPDTSKADEQAVIIDETKPTPQFVDVNSFNNSTNKKNSDTTKDRSDTARMTTFPPLL